MNQLQKKKEQLMKQTGFRQLFSFQIDSFVSVITHEPGEWIIQEGRRLNPCFTSLREKRKYMALIKMGKSLY
ncbi:hypothetical protein JCM19046_4339 [Bacillus sp. JCM 19046]|nr:hypothetical protein JCM19045_4915 [Bacillus sp. JCM 19045]GAF19671.1 hypothetical protein JCM19046_4339 [Bacillus sp. JCM 19046]